MLSNFKSVALPCVLSALVACYAIPASANLLNNPGFEISNTGETPVDGDGAEDWGAFNFGTFTTMQDTEPRTGAFGLHMGSAGTTSGSTGVFQAVTNTNVPDGEVGTILPGSTVTFSIWAKYDANSGAGPGTGFSSDDPAQGVNIQLEWFPDPNGSSTGGLISEVILEGMADPGSGAPFLTSSYQQYTIVAVAPSIANGDSDNTGHVRPVFRARHVSHDILWDDAVLTSILPPDTPAFSLTVDRGTGNLTLENFGSGTGNIKELKITSASGALDPISWNSITGNYDNTPVTGDGSVDINDIWSKTVQTNFELTEGETAGDAGFIAAAATVDLGNSTWLQSPIEDIVAEVTYEDGSSATITSVAVSYTGGANGGATFDRSDLNFDGSIDALDWPLLRDQLFTPIVGTSKALSYQAGDLNGDLVADFGDFNIFKADFDAVAGVGAFTAMLSGVPEPSSLVLLTFGALGISLSRKRRITGLCKAACLLAVVFAADMFAPAATAVAADVDFTTYTVDDYPLIAGSRFLTPTYTGSTASTATLDVSSNPHVFYGTQSIVNKRITGTINPGADNDFVGLALGYVAGDTSNSTNPGPGGADFILLDWKGADTNQTQEMDDEVPSTLFHFLTSAQTAKEGIGISRISGTPTGDELWGHVDLPENTGLAGKEGGVTELQRGAASGSIGYVKNQDYAFDISYTPTNITVKINGTEEINISGTFPAGVLGLYSMDQNPSSGAATYSNFKISDPTEGLLTATVNTLSGNVTLTNTTADPIDLNGYVLESASGSLELGSWNSLQNQDLPGFSAGTGTGNGWEEGVGSSNSVLVEGDLSSVSTLAAGAAISLGVAFDIVGTQDLVFNYNEGNGFAPTGLVNYVSTVEDADFDGDSDIDGLDFLTWQRGFIGGTTQAEGDANGSGGVEGADLAIWGTQFGTSGASSTFSVQGVPEPSSALLLILAACGLGVFRSRK